MFKHPTIRQSATCTYFPDCLEQVGASKNVILAFLFFITVYIWMMEYEWIDTHIVLK